MKNAWKFLAGCGCLSVMAGAALIGAAFFFFGADAVLRSGDDAAPARDDMTRYVNTREGRTGNLADNYVDFSFIYPKTWTIKTEDPDNINYVTVERSVEGKTYENFNVGYFTPAGSDDANQQLYRQVLGPIENQFAQQFRDFRKVSDGPTKVGPYDGYNALYDGWVEVNGKRVNVFVRAIFIPAPSGARGVSMMMIGTSLNPDLKEANDLGTKGELPLVLESFRFGG
ncbi:MAG TPA: hypothetical protein VND45_14610 [Thermoanaerobaculia bacterium]|nr:hypothetical protein [Thermoanaerobaculia bacterium]